MEDTEKKVASLGDILKFFGMSSGDLMNQWKNLPDEYKNYFKEEIGKTLI